MSSLNIIPPNLPNAPNQYEPRYHDQFGNVLRLFFTNLVSKVNAPLPHGSFYDTTTQTNPVAGDVNLMKFSNVYAISRATQFAIRRDTDRIYVSQTGVYNIQFSAQLDKTTGGSATTHIWIRVNGENVPNSATKVVISGNNDEKVAAWNWLLALKENDYIEIAWSADSTNVVLLAEPAAGNIPEIPSVIVSVTWASAIGV
jgi:hypothetical protein